MVRVGAGEAIEWGRRFRASGAIELVRLDEDVEERGLGDPRAPRRQALELCRCDLLRPDRARRAAARLSPSTPTSPSAACACMPDEVGVPRISSVAVRPRERLAPMPASRSYDRAPADIRPVTIEPGFVATADGSALISIGRDAGDLHRLGQRLGAALDAGPRQGLGHRRVRDAARLDRRPQGSATSRKGKQDGRGVEIQRLIGRSLRVVVDFKALGERSVYVDCDVLEADGGTRCAAITGGYVALRLALPEAARREGDRDDAADRLGRRGQRRHGRRPRALRPRLLRGLAPPRSTPTW